MTDDVEYGIDIARNAAVTTGLAFSGLGLAGLFMRRKRAIRKRRT